MKPVLTVFFDGLKPESLQFMPFINSFPNKRRMRTELGYSVACHPTMYSGVHPDKHLQWFIWKFSPGTSPFAWLKILKFPGFLDNLPSRYFLHKYTRMFRKGNTSWFGIPLLVNLPLKYWHYFDVVEDRSWDEPGYLKGYPTVFDILRSHKVEFDVIGMKNWAGDEFDQIGKHRFTQIRPWNYIFLGSIDGYSHRYGQNSPLTIERIKRLDQLVETKYTEFSRLVSDFDFFVFSDHGHIPVEKHIDIHKHFEIQGQPVNCYINLIDNNFARFWCRTDRERVDIERILSRLDGGFVLRSEHFSRYHLEMPDQRYGNIIYYLDRPAVFSKTIWGYGRNQKSTHGYLPDYADSDGVFVSNLPVVEGIRVELVDILPTILASLELPVPGYVEGRVLWDYGKGDDYIDGHLSREIDG